MTLFAISCILTSIFSFVLAFFVILKNRKESLNWSWFFVSFLMGVWGFGLWGVVTAGSYGQAMAFQYILDFSAIFIPLFYYKFTITLLRLKEKKKTELDLLWCVAIVLAVLSVFPAFKTGLSPIYEFRYWVNPGPIYPIFPIYFSLLMLYSFYLDFRYYHRFTSTTRSQIKYIMVAGLIGFVGGATNFFPQLLHIYPIGNYFVISYVALVAYAIVKYRLMGIRLIASRVYVYALIAIFSYAYFYLVVLVDDNALDGVYGQKALFFAPFFSLVFAILFIPLFKQIQKSSDIIFYSGYNPRKIIKNLGLQLSSVINLDELLTILEFEFKKILATENIEVYLLHKKEKDVCSFSPIKLPGAKDVIIEGIVCDEIMKSKAIIVRDEADKMGRKKLAKELDKLHSKVVAPLTLRSEVIGVILLDKKITDEAYSQEDIEFLEIISAQAAVAIENARLYKQVDEFNKTLQQKVDEQTRDIKDKTERLRRLIEMRSDFLDITSHQLRTPVSVIKGVLSMLDEGSIPEAKKQEFIRGALVKSIKLSEIINDILRASEMDSDKLQVKIKPTNLNELLAKIKEDKIKVAEMKKLKLEFVLPKKPLPPVLSDERYLEQVLINLINNSLQYTPKGTITVSAEVKKNVVIVRIKDTGIGIAPDELHKLFQKFGRAGNAVASYTDGSGLGLYIIKQIVGAHRGAKIELEHTELGKGTTFALTLPTRFSERIDAADS